MGDGVSFDAMYRELQPVIRRFLAARLGNESDAEDVTQETFIKLEQTAAKETIDNPKALAFSIARNLSVDLIRRNSRARTRESAYSEKTIDLAGGDYVDPTPTPEQSVAGRKEVERVLDSLSALSPKVRQTFVLHKIDGHPYADVARLMGISKSTVEKHMIKALRAIADVVK